MSQAGATGNATGGGITPVPSGGTGKTSFTPYAVITGGTTSTGPLQNVVGVGTSGQVLTSNGASALPSWQAGGGGGGAGSKVLIQAQTVSGVSAVNFTSGFGGYSYYYIEGYDVVATATTGVYGIIQLSYNGGSSYSSTGDTTCLIYSINGNLINGNLSYLLAITDASDTAPTIPATFQLNVYNIDSNSLSKTTNGTGMNFRDATGLVSSIFSAVTTVTSTCNALRFVYTDGSNFSGTFRLFGVV
jgi:hypothetical protein